ncbi:MAG: hypothetical protein KDD76_03200, partial [Rickettsiales bacterium]|nr:hypothetical protein [Rickettsiales bacterium]
QHAQRLLHVMSDHVELTMLAADALLRRAVERQYFNALFGKNLTEDMRSQFVQWVNETPQVALMFMTDEEGNIVALHSKHEYTSWLAEKVNVAHRAYFSEHVESDDPDLLVIEPHESWIHGQEFFVLSRRIVNLDGSFGGIVLAAVNNSYLLDFFDSLEAGAHTQLAVFTSDGSYLINQMGGEEEKHRLNEVIDEAQVNADQQQYIKTVSQGRFDPNLLLYALSHVPQLNVNIAVVLHGEDMLIPWWQGRIDDIIYLSIFTLFILATLMFSLAMSKQVRRARRSEQAALLASQAKSDFLANMSHELRTPLNAIIGFSDMLTSGYFGKLNTKQLERILDINLCGSHLLELINDILTYAKGSAGKLDLREESVSLQKVADECMRIVSERAQQGNVTLTNSLSDDMPKVRGDRRKIKQILINLMTNAVKFTKPGGRVELSAGFDDARNIVIVVTDNGMGMKEDDIPKALAVFGQVHKDTAIGGTGLGLPLSKMFAEMHGGMLEIRSLEGVGTRVTVMLPAERILQPVVPKSPPSDNGTATAIGKKSTETNAPQENQSPQPVVNGDTTKPDTKSEKESTQKPVKKPASKQKKKERVWAEV